LGDWGVLAAFGGECVGVGRSCWYRWNRLEMVVILILEWSHLKQY
jgi:hypothetical protein